jgi:hypothetical protein
VHTYNFRLKGAPERMFEQTISFANIVNGTGSLVLTEGADRRPLDACRAAAELAPAWMQQSILRRSPAFDTKRPVESGEGRLANR